MQRRYKTTSLVRFKRFGLVVFIASGMAIASSDSNLEKFSIEPVEANTRKHVAAELLKHIEATDFDLQQRNHRLRYERIKSLMQDVRFYDRNGWVKWRDEHADRVKNILAHHEAQSRLPKPI